MNDMFILITDKPSSKTADHNNNENCIPLRPVDVNISSDIQTVVYYENYITSHNNEYHATSIKIPEPHKMT